MQNKVTQINLTQMLKYISDKSNINKIAETICPKAQMIGIVISYQLSEGKQTYI